MSSNLVKQEGVSAIAILQTDELLICLADGLYVIMFRRLDITKRLLEDNREQFLQRGHPAVVHVIVFE